MSRNPAQQLIEFGQSVWYDNISRDMLDNGDLKRLIDNFGVRGLTSNPTIFENAINKSSVYDSTIAKFKGKNASTDQVFEEIAIEDIARAADLLLPVFNESNGDDGFVSIEVSPLLAGDTSGTVTEALRLSKRLNRPNIMIKVPGTAEGIPAVRQLLEEGISVNITLLFGVDDYVKVAKTYCEALRARVKAGKPVDKIRSVASFFVSRVDSVIDKSLEQVIAKASSPAQAEEAKSLIGKFGIDNCRVAYQKFLEIFNEKNFGDLKAKGAAVQRPLWASTSTKNPAYRDVIYVEQLIGADTVNTMPPATLDAFADHGELAETITRDVQNALTTEGRLIALGIDVKQEIKNLQLDGVKKFSDSFVSLNKAIEKKL